MPNIIYKVFRSEEKKEALSERSVISLESLAAGIGGARVTGCYAVKIALNRTQAFFPSVWSLGIVRKRKSAALPNIADADKILDGQIWRNALTENYVSPSLLYSLLNE